LQHDNATAPYAICVGLFLAQSNVSVLYLAPYSSDVAPAVFFLFRHLGITKGARYAGAETIQEIVIVILPSILTGAFAVGFH
jgi:hypothetical protein